MKTLAFVLVALAACGGKSPPAEPAAPPAPSADMPPEPATMTPDECVAKGGTVKGDIGDGKVACDDTQKELGRVSQGIEGAVCCIAADAAPMTP